MTGIFSINTDKYRLFVFIQGSQNFYQTLSQTHLMLCLTQSTLDLPVTSVVFFYKMCSDCTKVEMIQTTRARERSKVVKSE